MNAAQGDPRACGGGACAAVAVGIQQGLLAGIGIAGANSAGYRTEGPGIVKPPRNWSGGISPTSFIIINTAEERHTGNAHGTGRSGGRRLCAITHEFLSVTPMPWKRCISTSRARGAVSLVEVAYGRARVITSILAKKYMTAMERAHANESLFYRLLNLQSRLVAADSLDEMLVRFHRWAAIWVLPARRCVCSRIVGVWRAIALYASGF